MAAYARVRAVTIAVVLCGAMTAQAGFVGLYSEDGFQYFGPGANGQRRSQHFSPTQSTPNTLSDPQFDSAGFRITTDAGEALTGTLELYVWNTDIATTVAGPILGSVPVNVSGAFDAYIDVPVAPQPASGQYLLSLLVGTVTGADFGLRNSNSNDGGPNNDAYNATGIKTDREYQVRLNGVPEPVSLALLGLGGVFLLLRRR